MQSIKKIKYIRIREIFRCLFHLQPLIEMIAPHRSTFTNSGWILFSLQRHALKKWFIQFYRRFLDQLNPHSTLMTPSRSSVPTCSFPESPLAKAPPGAPHFKLPCGCGDQLLENSQNQVFIGLETELLKNIRIYNQIITRILFKWELYSSYWSSQCFTC